MKASVLTGGLPDGVMVSGVWVPVETDYRMGLLLDGLLRDTELPSAVRLALFIRFACGSAGEDVDRAALTEALLGFYAMGALQTGAAGEPGELLVDFAADGDRILASFQAAYGIDLLGVRMHWWQFLTLLSGLPPETVFMRTVRLRMLDLREIEDDGLRRRLRQAKRAVRLRTAEKGVLGHDRTTG